MIWFEQIHIMFCFMCVLPGPLMQSFQANFTAVFIHYDTWLFKCCYIGDWLHRGTENLEAQSDMNLMMMLKNALGLHLHLFFHVFPSQEQMEDQWLSKRKITSLKLSTLHKPACVLIISTANDMCTCVGVKMLSSGCVSKCHLKLNALRQVWAKV